MTILPIIEYLLDKAHSVMAGKRLHQAFIQAKDVIPDKMEFNVVISWGEFQAAIIQSLFQLAVIPDSSIIL
jgi:hypothetical protein